MPLTLIFIVRGLIFNIKGIIMTKKRLIFMPRGLNFNIKGFNITAPRLNFKVKGMHINPKGIKIKIKLSSDFKKGLILKPKPRRKLNSLVQLLKNTTLNINSRHCEYTLNIKAKKYPLKVNSGGTNSIIK
jgi:hypothetical protein